MGVGLRSRFVLAASAMVLPILQAARMHELDEHMLAALETTSQKELTTSQACWWTGGPKKLKKYYFEFQFDPRSKEHTAVQFIRDPEKPKLIIYQNASWLVRTPPPPPEFHLTFNTSSVTLGISLKRADDSGDGYQDVLIITAIKDGGLVKDYNDKLPKANISAGDRIVEVNGVRGNARRMYDELKRASNVKMGFQKTLEHTFTFEKAADKGLGISIASDKQMLVITAIQDSGLIPEMNDKSPEREIISAGDHIAAVNGVRLDARKMANELRKLGQVTLAIIKKDPHWPWIPDVKSPEAMEWLPSCYLSEKKCEGTHEIDLSSVSHIRKVIIPVEDPEGGANEEEIGIEIAFSDKTHLEFEGGAYLSNKLMLPAMKRALAESNDTVDFGQDVMGSFEAGDTMSSTFQATFSRGPMGAADLIIPGSLIAGLAAGVATQAAFAGAPMLLGIGTMMVATPLSGLALAAVVAAGFGGTHALWEYHQQNKELGLSATEKIWYKLECHDAFTRCNHDLVVPKGGSCPE
jgi:hypothetical protein